MAYSVGITRRPLEALFDVRGNFKAFSTALGQAEFPRPTRPNSLVDVKGSTLYWVGPAHWLLRAPANQEQALATRLQQSARSLDVSVVRVSDAYIGFDIAGEDAQAVLAQATPLDIHTAIFPPGSASFTEFFGQTALISRKSERNRFTAYVPRSHADYLEACLRYAKG